MSFSFKPPFFISISPSYQILLTSRIITGAFGGILSAIGLSVIGDAFPYEKRGTAMGIMMASFSLASVVGVPVGLFLAAIANWQTPFYILAGISLAALITAQFLFPSMRGHMIDSETTNHPSPLESIKIIFGKAEHLWAISLTFLLMFAGFSIIPFISPYLVANVGVTEHQLPLVFFFGGLFTFFTGQIIGRLADRFGKHNVFITLSVLSVIPMLLITHLSITPLPLVLTTTVLFMVLVSGRMVPTMAMITAVISPQNRGSFMSFNSAVQQTACGVAALVSGTILVKNIDGSLMNYGQIGIYAVIISVLCIWISLKLKPVSTKAVD
jgi:predicted MFS family arabinose efflux permease